MVFTHLLHDNTIVVLICYRQAGKEVKRRTSKIFKRINSQNLYSYKHTGRTIWSVLLAAARELTFQTFAKLRNDKRSTCCFADGLREAVWHSDQQWKAGVENWPETEVDPYRQSKSSDLIPPTLVLFRKITCEQEWTLNTPQPTDKRLYFRGKRSSVEQQSAVCRPIDKSIQS